MNNPHQRPVTNPSNFAKSVFDLAYGTQDGTEKLSSAEVAQALVEAGIDPEATWKAFQSHLYPKPAEKPLEFVRKERLAAAQPEQKAFTARSAQTIVAEIKKFLESLEPSDAAAVFGRNWENSPPEDLIAIYEQLKRQAKRNDNK
ncbi:MAG TPA: hypothetical protein VGD97_00865 [Lacunisphaera sp.]